MSRRTQRKKYIGKKFVNKTLDSFHSEVTHTHTHTHQAHFESGSLSYYTQHSGGKFKAQYFQYFGLSGGKLFFTV